MKPQIKLTAVNGKSAKVSRLDDQVTLELWLTFVQFLLILVDVMWLEFNMIVDWYFILLMDW